MSFGTIDTMLRLKVILCPLTISVLIVAFHNFPVSAPPSVVWQKIIVLVRTFINENVEQGYPLLYTIIRYVQLLGIVHVIVADDFLKLQENTFSKINSFPKLLFSKNKLSIPYPLFYML